VGIMNKFAYIVSRFLKAFVAIFGFSFVFFDVQNLVVAMIFTVVMEIGLTLAFWGIGEDEDDDE